MYASWRPWWNIWRHSHALDRYGKDPTARRSAHASKVWLIILYVRQNIPPRRLSKRIVQRRYPSVFRVFSWYHNLLRSLRIQQEAYVRCWHKSITGLSRWRYVNPVLRSLRKRTDQCRLHCRLRRFICLRALGSAQD